VQYDAVFLKPIDPKSSVRCLLATCDGGMLSRN